MSNETESHEKQEPSTVKASRERVITGTDVRRSQWHRDERSGHHPRNPFYIRTVEGESLS